MTEGKKHGVMFVFAENDDAIRIHTTIAPHNEERMYFEFTGLAALCGERPAKWISARPIIMGADPESMCSGCLSELSTYGSAVRTFTGTDCESCGTKLTEFVARTTRLLLAGLDETRRGIIRGDYEQAGAEMPNTLCASCFNSMLSRANDASESPANKMAFAQPSGTDE